MISKKIAAIAILALATSATAIAETQVIAHRGHWDQPGAAQNSIRAIVKADSIGCYGSEFDVWMTADSVLVVNHDPTFNNIHIATSDARTILSQKLSNGENIPALEQYLDTAAILSTRLIFELKSHPTRQQEQQAVLKSLSMIAEKGLSDRTEYIVFSKDAMLDFIKYAPAGTPVYYLNGDMTPQELKDAGAAGPDYHISVFQTHPEWIDQCHELGMKVNAWTVNDPDLMQWCIDRGIDFITTNAPETLQKLLP